MNHENLKEDIEQNCRFCNPPDKERIIYETDNFYVMLSLGPIVEGYLLIVTKEHISTCAFIEHEEEFDSLASKIREILTAEYGGCLFYEHGRAGTCLTFSEGSKHCYHAHMHCLPLNIELNKKMNKKFLKVSTKDWNTFRKIIHEYNEPYLFVDDGEKIVHFVVQEDIRRQYLRYLTAMEIGKENLWDWINEQGWDKIKSAKIKLKPHFDALYKKI